jgi:hypothetical protein
VSSHDAVPQALTCAFCRRLSGKVKATVFISALFALLSLRALMMIFNRCFVFGDRRDARFGTMAPASGGGQ